MFGVVGWRTGSVPVLSLVDLGFHELGHMLAMPLPALVTAVMGSLIQIAVPAGLATYFWLVRRDDIGAGVCLGWAGTSAWNVAVYVADAPYERLQLIGGDHDWAYTLFELDRMALADDLAAAVRFVGLVLVVAGAVVASRPLWPRRQPPPPPPSFKGRIRVHG